MKTGHEYMWPPRGMEDSDMEAQHWSVSFPDLHIHLSSLSLSERALNPTVLPPSINALQAAP